MSMAKLGMKRQILHTKLQRPPVAPDILPRARLLDRLNEGRWRPLTLICAPAGYGKSTLASCWVVACDCPGGWLSVDKGEDDLRTFLSYFLAGIQLLFPDREMRTEALLEASRMPSVSDVSRNLLNDLHPITTPFILVLDDYHHIQNKDIQDLMQDLLAYPPRAMHLVLVTRRDPPLSLSRLRGHDQMTEIRAADLRFTPAEGKALLSKMIRVPIDDETGALLENKTEGWAAGLRLAGLYLRDQDDPKHQVQSLSGSSQHIAVYMVEEVLSKQDPEMVACLIEVSILDRFCAPLCRLVHGKGIEGQNEKQGLDAQQFIEWLVEANLFVIPLDDQGYWFRYHHLFQQFLQNLLRKQASPETIAGLHRHASSWFAENGLIDEAIRHALAAGDTEVAAQLVIDHRYDLMNTLQFHRLYSWLVLLPEDTIAQSPLLLSTKAHLGLQLGWVGDVHACFEQVQSMMAKFPTQSIESQTINGELAALRGVAYLHSGPSASAIAAGRTAIQMLPDHALSIRSLAIAAIAGGQQMEGNLSESVKSVKDALADIDLPAPIRARMWYYICVVNFMDVNTSGAVVSGRECLRIATASKAFHTKSSARYFLGAVHYLSNELNESKSYLLSLLEDRMVFNAVFVAQACGILAFIYLSEGRPAESGQVIEEVSKNSREIQDNYSISVRQALQVELALRQERVEEARQKSIGVDFDMRPPIWLLYVPQLTFIKLLLAEDTGKSLQEAHTRLAELDGQMARINRKNVRIDVLALLALVCYKLSEEAAALEKLQAALDLAEPGGWIRNFIDLGAPMADLLERLIQLQPGHAYAQQVLDACRAESRSNYLGEKTSRLSGPTPPQILTQRETELLPMLAEGLSNKEIAARLYISPATVKTHLQNIYGKLDVKGRIEALRKARELGLTTDD